MIHTVRLILQVRMRIKWEPSCCMVMLVPTMEMSGADRQQCFKNLLIVPCRGASCAAHVFLCRLQCHKQLPYITSNVCITIKSMSRAYQTITYRLILTWVNQYYGHDLSYRLNKYSKNYAINFLHTFNSVLCIYQHRNSLM